VDDVVLVSEEQMLRAIETLLMEEHVLAEPAGAASAAALLKGSAGFGDHVVLVVSGANIFARSVEKIHRQPRTTIRRYDRPSLLCEPEPQEPPAPDFHADHLDLLC